MNGAEAGFPEAVTIFDHNFKKVDPLLNSSQGTFVLFLSEY